MLRKIKNTVCDLMFGDNVEGKVVINGVEYTGNSIQVSGNGSIIVNGDHVCTATDHVVNVFVMGSCHSVSTVSGDVNISGSVSGDVSSTSGDIECVNVKGNVSTTSGDVEAHAIHGHVNTISGDINVNE